MQNHKLHMENVVLRQRSSGLLTENQELRERLGLHTLDSKDSVRHLDTVPEEGGGVQAERLISVVSPLRSRSWCPPGVRRG